MISLDDVLSCHALYYVKTSMDLLGCQSNPPLGLAFRVYNITGALIVLSHNDRGVRFTDNGRVLYYKVFLSVTKAFALFSHELANTDFHGLRQIMGR